MKKIPSSKFSHIFDDLFGFEKGIDISDETQVLFRRNVVIKNIIFVSNLVYTILLMILSILNSTSSNWILTVILFPLTFLINNTLKKTIYKHSDDFFHQQIAMYIAVFYMFLSSILIYMKMKNADSSFGEAGYILIYYSLVVISLYQDKKMLKTISKWLLVVVTILHFSVTYNLINSSNEGSMLQQVLAFIKSTEFSDIVMRTIILIVFMVILYVIVSISQYMQEERRKELLKRKNVQDDFTSVVTEMFKVTLNDNTISKEEHEHIVMVSEMSYRLASILGLPPEACKACKDFSRIHIDKKVDLDLSNILDNDAQFEHLRNQTSLGNEIVKRLELSRKCENIIRAHEEGYSDSESYLQFKNEKMTEQGQIILITDMYISLRSVRSYKRPFPHRLSIEIMEKEFRSYFDTYIFERFVRFQDEFEKMYDEF